MTEENTLKTFVAPLENKDYHPLSIFNVGLSLSLFLALTYLICVGFDLMFPAYAMNSAWSSFLPGFVWLSWASFFLGLIETLVYGWYIGGVFVPIYNFVSR